MTGARYVVLSYVDGEVWDVMVSTDRATVDSYIATEQAAGRVAIMTQLSGTRRVAGMHGRRLATRSIQDALNDSDQ